MKRFAVYVGILVGVELVAYVIERIVLAAGGTVNTEVTAGCGVAAVVVGWCIAASQFKQKDVARQGNGQR